MKDNDFESAFNGASTVRPTFVERVGRADALNEQAKAAAPPEPSEYKAYGFLPTGNIGETCDVQRWVDGTQVAEGVEFQYRFLLQVAYIGERELRLFLPDSIIVIEGENLRELRKKLSRRQVTFIQQYSPLIWPSGLIKGSIVVKAVQVVRPT